MKAGKKRTSLDDIGFIGIQRKLTKKQLLEEMRETSKAMRLYKARQSRKLRSRSQQEAV